MKLVIIEAPGKLASFRKYLGKDYDVVASKGHLLDLPKKGLGIDLKKDFATTYEVLTGKESLLAEIKSKAAKVEQIIIFTDSDREGCGIGFNIADLLSEYSKKIVRATSNAITQDAINNAIKNAYPLENDRFTYDSYEARRVLDRLCGYKTSFIVKQSTGGDSAGRVQSAALRILAERENEIIKFIPQEYWPIDAKLKTKNGNICAKLTTPDSLEVKTEKQAKEITQFLESHKPKVSKYDVKEEEVKPYPPFVTLSLMQAASSILHWDQKRTMSVAQKLYESGKCLLEDELVVLHDGTIDKIINAKNYLGKTVCSFNNGSENWLKSDKATINAYQCFPYDGNIVHIRTLDGQEISITPDHKLYSKRDGENVKWKEGQELRIGDFLLCAKNIEVIRKERNIGIEDFIIQLPVKILNKIIIGVHDDEWEEIITKMRILFKNGVIKEPTFYKHRKNKTVRAEWLDKETLLKIARSCRFYRWSAPGSKNEKITPETFCYFLGLTLGDGHLPTCPHVSFATVTAQSIGWGNLMQSVYLGSPRKAGIGKTVTVFSGRILHSLCVFFGGTIGVKHDKIYIHPFISSLPENLIWKFLAGAFDSDGCMRAVRNRFNVSYATKNPSYAKQISVLLRTLGIRSGFHRKKGDQENCSVKILEIDHKEFLYKIIEHLYVKKEYVRNLLPSISNHTCQHDNFPVIDLVECDRIKNGLTKQQVSEIIFGNSTTYWNYLRICDGHTRPSRIPPDTLLKLADLFQNNTLRMIANGDAFFAEIKTIILKPYAGNVYDISTSSENFIASGFYSHNCSYHRSDSTFIEQNHLNAIREYVGSSFDEVYQPTRPNVYSISKNAQQAHEAIQPTDVKLCHYGSGDEASLYELVWKRTVASQMNPAKYRRISAQYTCGDYILRSSGSEKMFDGYRKVWTYVNDEDVKHPALTIGDLVEVESTHTEQKFTEPPRRYSDVSLSKKLESVGIGRPSTWSSVIPTLTARKYVSFDKKSCKVTDLGLRVNDFLIKTGFCFIDIDFTANLEKQLDEIEERKVGKICVLNDFWKRLQEDIVKANQSKTDNSKTEYKCPLCEGFLLKKFSKFGPFFSCENQPKTRKSCPYKADVGEDGKPKEQVKKAPAEVTEFLCPVCGKNLVIRKGKYGDFLGCAGFPKCKSGFFNLDGTKKETKKKKWFKRGVNKSKDIE